MMESKVVKEWQEQASRKSRVEDVLDILQDKFGDLPTDLAAHLDAIDDVNVLRQLHRKALHASSIEDFQRQMPNGVQ